MGGKGGGGGREGGEGNGRRGEGSGGWDITDQCCGPSIFSFVLSCILLLSMYQPGVLSSIVGHARCPLPRCSLPRCSFSARECKSSLGLAFRLQSVASRFPVPGRSSSLGESVRRAPRSYCS